MGPAAEKQCDDCHRIAAGLPKPDAFVRPVTLDEAESSQKASNRPLRTSPFS